MSNSKIKVGWYGWIPDGEGRRAARVAQIQSDGTLLVQLSGIAKIQHEVDPDTFIPDPTAQFWEGHCPSEAEHKAAVDKLRAEMTAAEDYAEVYIFALADPDSHEIRYVGSFGSDEPAECGYPALVNEWVASLEQDPIRVNVDTYQFNDQLTYSENKAAALELEAKWRRWFSNSPLLPPGETAPQESWDTA